VNTGGGGAVARAGHARSHIVTTAVEHSAVLDACRRSEVELTVVPVDGVGRFDPDAASDAIRPDTALVSVQLANHEVGTVQPAAAVTAACREQGVLVHVDACMAVGHLPVDFAALGADLCSITAHKLGGPKGAGALLVRRGLRVPQLIVGGAQERARRGGLEDVPAMVGFGAAVAVLAEEDRLAAETAAARRLTDRVAAEAAARVAGMARYGDPDDRVPHLVCLGIEGVEAEPVLLGLDQRGVAVHSGSACSSEVLEPSPILAAMGVDAEHSLRVSVGWDTTDADVDAFLDAFPTVVDRLRALRAG
jgi:cysteine desulfurase